MKKRTQEYSFKNRIADASEFPKDVFLGQPILTVLGRMEINIENYRGITEYTDALIRIRTKTGQIRITGRALQIEYYTNDDMKVTGRIDSIDYRQKGET